MTGHLSHWGIYPHFTLGIILSLSNHCKVMRSGHMANESFRQLKEFSYIELLSGVMMVLNERSDFFRVALCICILRCTSIIQVEGIASTSDQNTAPPEVTILQGRLQGTILFTKNNRSISAFQGIPYAEPPIGNLRFNNPVVVQPWEGMLNATREGNSCPQISRGKVIGKEDCLYLNVYTPKLPGKDEILLLPVMVWIHGGSLQMGNGNSDLYGPGHLLDADIILVSMNYRLGPLGFFSTGDEMAPGNSGLKDQVLALKWVQENIAYFGGDPNQVTIFGQSAGGASVQLLALSQLTTGLFHKYISQSGSALGFRTYRPRTVYVKIAFKLGEYVGCPTNSSTVLVKCLRELNASEIIEIGSQRRNFPMTIWGPTDEPDSEGAFLTDTPANLFNAGKIRDIPSMTGTVRDEGVVFSAYYLKDSDSLNSFLDNFDNIYPTALQFSNQVEDVPALTAALKKYYFNDDLTSDRSSLVHNITVLWGDSYIIYPVYRALQKQYTFATNSPYFYSFEYEGTYSYEKTYISSPLINKTVTHCDELFYLFPQTETLIGTAAAEMSETDLGMIDTMVQLWTSFAINGTPTAPARFGNVTWLPYSNDHNYLRIGNGADGVIDIQYNFQRERMQFWNQLLVNMSVP